MKRDIDLGFFLIVAIVAYGFLAMLNLPAHSADRIYPYTGLKYRVQESEAPVLRAELGAAYSLGPIAPSLTGSVALNGKLSPGLEIGLRVRF